MKIQGDFDVVLAPPCFFIYEINLFLLNIKEFKYIF